MERGGKPVWRKTGKRCAFRDFPCEKNPFRGVWKTLRKRCKTSGFPRRTGFFHSDTPNSFPVWKTIFSDACHVVPNPPPAPGSGREFHILSAVFRRFCERFSVRKSPPTRRKRIHRCRNPRFSVFPHSPHPLLRLLRLYSIYSFFLSLSRPGARSKINRTTPCHTTYRKSTT